jgi:hypothetical protein
MTHTNRKAIKDAYTQYCKSQYCTLDDCYGQYSYAKQRAYNYCLDLVQKYNGIEYGIINFNTFGFSFGFIGTLDGNRQAFFYITKEYDRYIFIDELEV